MEQSIGSMKTTSDFGRKLYDLWNKSVVAYEREAKVGANLFDQSELDFLEANGMTIQNLYDYAEDFVNCGEPDFAMVLLIQEVCRDYLLEECAGIVSRKKLSADAFPERTLEKEGIVGLDRIFEKARAKLHGEISSELMYSCPSDRAFLRENHIHPAEFLRLVWFYEKNRDPKDDLVKWILHRRKQHRE